VVFCELVSSHVHVFSEKLVTGRRGGRDVRAVQKAESAYCTIHSI
jgi:hypothetical protein